MVLSSSALYPRAAANAGVRRRGYVRFVIVVAQQAGNHTLFKPRDGKDCRTRAPVREQMPGLRHTSGVQVGPQ